MQVLPEADLHYEVRVHRQIRRWFQTVSVRPRVNTAASTIIEMVFFLGLGVRGVLQGLNGLVLSYFPIGPACEEAVVPLMAWPCFLRPHSNRGNVPGT